MSISIESLTESQKQQIIKLGRANDRLNNHAIKISLPPFLLGTILILLYGFNLWNQSYVMPLGILFLLVGCCIPLVWFISLTVRASKSEVYSYSLYQSLLKNQNAAKINQNSAIVLQQNASESKPQSDSDNSTTKDTRSDEKRLTTQDIINQFDGDVEKALTHILWTYEYEELDKFIFEWNNEQLCIARKLIEERAAQEEIKERFNMTPQEMIDTPNPYVKKMCISIAVLVAIYIVIWVLVTVLKNNDFSIEKLKDYGYMALSAITSLQAMKIAGDLLAMIRYSKAKKRLKKTNK